MAAGHLVTAVDPDPEMVALARAQTPEVQQTMREVFAQAAAPWLSEGELVFPVVAVLVWASA